MAPDKAAGGAATEAYFLPVRRRETRRRERRWEIFSTFSMKGATGFDGDTEVIGACRAPRVS